MLLSEAPPSEMGSALFSRDMADQGYVSNLARLWAWRPDIFDAFLKLRSLLTDKATLSMRERAVLVCATAAKVGDSYCSLAWGTRLAVESDPATAAALLQRQTPPALNSRERALARWAEQVVSDPNAISAQDVDRLRDAGLSDDQIFNATVFVAFRLAFSTVNDALGARPDAQLAASAPAAVRDAVKYGRAVAGRS
ncbi:MAG TPA: hypothetical protein VFJ70_06475 [Burkholderiales bacterium]|nr:hypothetical protein [Burkholderiales bacterium]